MIEKKYFYENVDLLSKTFLECFENVLDVFNIVLNMNFRLCVYVNILKF